MTTVENSGEKDFNPIDLPVNVDSDTCPECGGHILIKTKGGDSVCEKCGLVVNEKRVDISLNKRAYTERERKAKLHTGDPITPLVAHMSFSTVIKKERIENPDLKRAVKWNTRLGGETRSLLASITEIKRIGSNQSVPYHILSSAVLYYKQLAKANLIRGRRIPNIVVACLLFACRKAKFPRTLEDLMEKRSSDERKKRIMRCYKLIIDQTGESPQPISPLSFLPRYLSELGVNSDTEHLISQVYRAYVSRTRISGSTPFGIMGGAIYFVCKHKELNKNQKDIANIVGITEVTLRKKYKDIASKIGFK